MGRRKEKPVTGFEFMPGFDPSRDPAWIDRVEEFVSFQQQLGSKWPNTRAPRTSEEWFYAQWLNRMRANKVKGTLSKFRIAHLDAYMPGWDNANYWRELEDQSNQLATFSDAGHTNLVTLTFEQKRNITHHV